MTCPFCDLDPYEYVDVGIGCIPVAVNCCEWGYMLIVEGIPFEELVLAKEADDEIDRQQEAIWVEACRAYLEEDTVFEEEADIPF